MLRLNYTLRWSCDQLGRLYGSLSSEEMAAVATLFFISLLEEMFYNLLSSISVSAKTMDEEVMLIEPLAIEEPPKAVAKC